MNEQNSRKIFDTKSCFVCKDQSHAHKKEILSYLHIPKTTTMCYMYEANNSDYDINGLSVSKQRIKVLMQLCHITSLFPPI